MARALVNVLASFVLFVGVFLAFFWTPGLLLALFAAAFVADTQAFSHVRGRTRRAAQLSQAARRYRGGWLDSTVRVE
jgi:hypothetical protein